MPIITINLVPPSTPQDVLEQLMHDMHAAVAGIPELNITVEEVTVLFPHDLLAYGIGSELIIKVDGLHKKPDRTKEVLDRLWVAIGEVAQHFAETHLLQCKKIEVVPSDFDQDRDGYWEYVFPSKSYFPHNYPGDPAKNNGECWTSNCIYKCGCWAGPARSGGPDGVDPFGECPNHPDRVTKGS